MTISTRILRAEADALETRPRFLTEREILRQDRILDTATVLLARHGTHAISYRALALALRLSKATLQFHFIDMDDLLGAILSRHLRTLATALGEAAAAAPDAPHAARRAAWQRATREGLGTHTHAHRLLLRDRFVLPDDLRETIEASYRNLGALLSETGTQDVRAMLDDEEADLPRIETLLSAAPSAPRRYPAPVLVVPAPPEPSPSLFCQMQTLEQGAAAPENPKAQEAEDPETWSEIVNRMLAAHAARRAGEKQRLLPQRPAAKPPRRH